MRRADIEVPNLPVAVNAWERSACYPRGSLYPLIHGPSTRNRRVTLPDFRPCSACKPHSQAFLYQCAQRLISIQPEKTFGRLRYLLGGDRPSQTAHQTLSPDLRVRRKTWEEWYFKVGSTPAGTGASKPPTYPTHPKPAFNVKLQ
jgi:hypothetical protein